jgi:hypothetical protein
LRQSAVKMENFALVFCGKTVENYILSVENYTLQIYILTPLPLIAKI